MDNVTQDMAVNTVIHVASSEEIKARSVDAMKSLEMMGLARGAEAALIEAGLPSISLSFSVSEPGKITLTGTVSEQSNKIRAEEILRGFKGVKSIDNQIKVILHYSGGI